MNKNTANEYIGIISIIVIVVLAIVLLFYYFFSHHSDSTPSVPLEAPNVMEEGQGNSKK